MTELQTLKAKCYNKNGSVKKGATPVDLARLKVLQDGEPLSAADLEVAKQREEERATQDKKDFEARQTTKVGAEVVPAAISAETASFSASNEVRVSPESPEAVEAPTSLDPPPEHPRIVKLKDALRVFTQIEAHESRPDDFVLFTRDVSITAGDVRRARKAMTL